MRVREPIGAATARERRAVRYGSELRLWCAAFAGGLQPYRTARRSLAVAAPIGSRLGPGTTFDGADSRNGTQLNGHGARLKTNGARSRNRQPDLAQSRNSRRGINAGCHGLRRRTRENRHRHSDKKPLLVAMQDAGGSACTRLRDSHDKVWLRTPCKATQLELDS